MDKSPACTFFKKRHTNGQQVLEKVLNIISDQENANHLTHVKMSTVLSKRQEIKKCWQGCEEKENFVHCCGHVNCYSHYGKQYGGFSKN